MSAFTDLDLFTGVAPSAVRIGAEVAWKNRYFDIQAMAGLEGHFFPPALLKPLLSDGIASAVLVSWKPTRYFNISLGIGVFPVGLVTDDTSFRPKSYPVTSQLLFLFTLGEDAPGLREFMYP